MEFIKTSPSQKKIIKILSVIIFSLFILIRTAPAQTAVHVVISEVYGGGGNSGSTYKNDFIELYNPTSSPVDLNGWTVQYASSTGSSWQLTNLTGAIAAHGFYLVQEAQGSGGSVNLPVPDETGIIAMSSSNGKVALVSSSSALNGTNPADNSIIDKVGYGSANGYEGSAPAPSPSNSTSIERKSNKNSTSTSMETGGTDEFEGNGYDSDDNAEDFIVRSSPQPQNSSSRREPALDTGGNGTGTAAISPGSIEAAATADLTLIIAGDGIHTLDSVLIVVSSSQGWIWNRSLSDVTVSGAAAAYASVAITEDTVFIGNLSVTSSDSLKVKIKNVTAPDSSLSSSFNVETAVAGGIPLPLNILPEIHVIKVVPIISLHVNDSEGLPTAPFGIGASVTISGIITADYNLSYTDIYVQDATAGIDIYSPERYYNYQIGDSITVTGTITQYRGLTEISPDSALFIIHSHGNKIPEPAELTAEEVNLTFNPEDYTEPNEGRLVRLNGVTYNAANETVTDGTGTTGAYFGSIIPPGGTFDLIGILKQYKPGTPISAPFTGNYEVNPRSQADIIVSAGPTYLTKPQEENILPNSVTIKFKTLQTSQAVIKYGKTVTYTDSVIVPGADTVHTVMITGLWPSTVYHYQVGAKDADGVNYTGDKLFSTASPSGTTGEMDVYFNHSVDISVSAGEAAQTLNISQKFIDRINSAEHSIDLALYSLSGTVGATVANVLISAKNRGVKIRVIGEYDNHGTAPWTTLSNAKIPVIFDNFDPANAGAGLMHNKFAVFDFRDTTSFTDDWVWTGSWNATDPGNNNDAQNVIEIQDKSLANAYTMEFNEMWGSDTDAPDQSNSRFGIRKTDNTPHRFNIAGTDVELYFDPSDNTTSHIADALNASESSIDIAMLTFTRSDLAQILINKTNSGEKVHIILDNNTDIGNQFGFMKDNGVDILLKGNSLAGLLHHKYAVIDADKSSADQVVITGSHNWTNAAENSNNENTLIIHSRRIANLYLQEFKARYIEAGGTNVITGAEKISKSKLPVSFKLRQNYPNPFNPSTSISFSVPKESLVTLKVYDILGRQVRTLVNKETFPGEYTVNFNAADLSSGIYFYSLNAGNIYIVKKMILLK